MYGLSATGFVKKTFEEILESIQDYQQSHVSASLTRNPLSVIGTQNTAIANELALLWETAQNTYSANNSEGAEGAALRDICALVGLYPSTSTKTLVTAQVTLNPGKNLPVGSIANLAGRSDLRFLSTAEVPAAVGGGTFDCLFEAEAAGSTVVELGQLSEISVAVPGWVAVTNAAAGIVGDHEESDEELLYLLSALNSVRGSTNVDAIKARVLSKNGVTDCLVTENDSDLADAYLTPGHTIWCIVSGGTDLDIATAIFESKAAGINTRGIESDIITDSQGYAHVERFDRSSVVAVLINADLVIEQDADTDGVLLDVENAVIAYVNAIPMGGTLYIAQLSCLILSRAGVAQIQALTIDGEEENYELSFKEKFSIGSSDVAVFDSGE